MKYIKKMSRKTRLEYSSIVWALLNNLSRAVDEGSNPDVCFKNFGSSKFFNRL